LDTENNFFIRHLETVAMNETTTKSYETAITNALVRPRMH